MVPPGECGTCRQAHVVRSARGAVFYLCLRSRTDARYPKYPALPRWQCAGYAPEPHDLVSDPSPAVPDVCIREATAADVPIIRGFIEQLADYEHLRDQVDVTDADLGAHLFGPQRAAEVLIASLAGRDVGFALFFQTFSTFVGRPGMHLEDLFVEPAARGAGVGRALLRHLATIAETRGYGRLEWNVLTWNASAIAFYQRLGAFVLDEWQTYRLDREGIRALAAGGPAPSPHHD